MRLKKMLTIAVLIVILVAVSFSYMGATFRNLLAHPAKPPVPPKPYISASLVSTNLLSFNSSRELVPYALLYYSARNVSKVYINATFLRRPPPKNIYILNVSNSCPFNCQNLFGIIASVRNDLVLYGLVANQSYVPIISQQSLPSIPNDSALIIMSSAMPYSMFTNVSGTNQTLIDELMNKGTDIVYVGGNFSYATQGPILVNVSSSVLPIFLSWTQKNVTYRTNDTFFFNKSTYSFTFGHRYGPLTYVNYTNGSILAFPNYLTAWKNASDAGQDIAKTISQLFWLPRYSYGAATANLTSFTNSSGRLGVTMASLSPGFNYNMTKRQRAGYGRAVVYTSNGYSIGNLSDMYRYISYSTSFALNGTLSMPRTIVPAVQIIPIPTITLFTRSAQRKLYSPHMAIYNSNLTLVQTVPLSSFNASGNITIIEPLTLYLSPGRYIVQVLSFYDNQYATGVLNVSPINISLSRANYTGGRFIFTIESANVPLSGIKYNISLNRLYPASGTVSNGTILYTLPSGTPQIHGNLTFSISMLSSTFRYSASNTPLSINIPSQYLELAVVIIVIFVLVTVVRAPNRDEFYIDVPSLREAQKVPIKLKANDMVSAFDKLNVYYHWKFMPLSVEEARVAVANNIRFNNMSVSLTHGNMEVLLNQLVSAGYLVSADGLYAPKNWVAQSGHDIDYLATFKKLRMHLVTHAYVFTEIDTSDRADMIATIHNERIYIVVYSRTSKFQRVPILTSSKTYLAFLNSYKLDEFEEYLHGSMTPMAEELRMYISAGQIKLVDADNPEDMLT